MIKGKLFLSDNEVKTIDGWKVPYVNGEDAKLFSYTVTLCCNCISCDNISTIFMISGSDNTFCEIFRWNLEKLIAL